MTEQKCPKCGAAASDKWLPTKWRQVFSCGTVVYHDGDIYEMAQCLANQLATAIAERDAARAEVEVLWTAMQLFHNPDDYNELDECIVDNIPAEHTVPWVLAVAQSMIDADAGGRDEM